MRGAWLSISAGLYDEEIQAVADIRQRLLLAQVNTVDQTWRPAVSRIAAGGGNGLIVEGRNRPRQLDRPPGQTAAGDPHRVFHHQPRAARDRHGGGPGDGTAQRRGTPRQHPRPAVSADLAGQADAVGAIEVVLHFPTDQKAPRTSTTHPT